MPTVTEATQVAAKTSMVAFPKLCHKTLVLAGANLVFLKRPCITKAQDKLLADADEQEGEHETPSGAHASSMCGFSFPGRVCQALASGS